MKSKSFIKPKNHSKIPGLNSLRFFAFLAVFLFHTTSTVFFGFLGVDFFFVLSSFLLTYLALQEIERNQEFSQRNFFIRRSLRIFPLYFLIVFFSFIILPILAAYAGFDVTLPQNKVLYWTFLSNYEFSNTILPLKFLWSIAVEEQFYLLFLLLSFFFKKRFILVLICLYISYFLYSIAALQLGWDNNDALGAHLIKFCVGMTAGWLFFRRKTSRIWILPLFFIISMLLFFFSWETVAFNVILSLWFGLLILTSIKICRIFEKNRAFQISEYPGKFIYGLYIYSGFIIIFGNKFLSIDNKFILIIIEFSVLFIVAFLSFNFFEKYFLKLKKYFRKVALFRQTLFLSLHNLTFPAEFSHN